MKEDKYAPIQQETPGMVSPDKPKIKKNKKMVLVFFAVAFIAIVFAGLFGMRSLGLFGKKAVSVPAEVQTSEMQLKQLLEERRELESRIRTLEEERENLQTNMAEMLAKRVEPLQRQVEELESIRNEISSLRREMANLVVVREEEETEEEWEPKEGSDSETILFSQLAEYNERLDKLASSERIEPKFSKAKGVQTGQMIKGRLLTALISSTAVQDFYAVVETTEGFSVEGKMTLPAGVRFLGKVIPDFASRRIFVKIEKMQYKDVEMPVSGLVLDERGNPGLVTKYIDPLNQAMWSSLIPNMLAAAADAAQDMVTYYDRDYYEERERPEFSERNVALQGAADSLRMQARILAEIQARKSPVIIVERDIPVQIQVTERIPLDILLEAGVVGK